VHVTDTDCGIGEQEREAVLRRLCRSDKIRSTPGLRFGLKLVVAIVKLRGFRRAIQAGPLAIICPTSKA